MMSKGSSLKQKTIKGLFWSMGDLIANQGIQFIIQIVLARLLLPEHFGVIGMILVFILISTIIVDSGFSQALIREQKVTQADYSTVFYFNLLLSCGLYGFLFVSAPFVSDFFNEPQLTLILRVLSLGIIFNALGIVQSTMLAKDIDFKTRTKINLISGVLSGIIAVILAILGFGVWSLVIRNLSMQFFYLIFLWLYKDWKPSLLFSYHSFKRLFGFGSKLMLAGLISVIYSNIYYVLIGKMYSVTHLGYYTNAVKVTEAASLSITAALQRVTYPVLSEIQDEEERLKYGFRKIIRISAFINFPLMVGLAAIADPLVNLLFGDKWMPMVIYFQLLCIAGMLYPVHAIDLNILQVKGKSNLYLQLSIVRKVILTILILLAIWFELGVIGLIGVLVVQSFIEFTINSYYAGKEISYSTFDHIRDILPIFSITVAMGLLVTFIGMMLPVGNLMKITIQIIVGFSIYIAISRATKVQELKMLLDFLFPIMKNLFIKKEKVANN